LVIPKQDAPPIADYYIICYVTLMESIPKKNFSAKEERQYPRIDSSSGAALPPESPPPNQLETNVEQHLYGTVHLVEGGKVFVDGDFC
jgi:hypothetical protein